MATLLPPFPRARVVRRSLPFIWSNLRGFLRNLTDRDKAPLSCLIPSSRVAASPSSERRSPRHPVACPSGRETRRRHPARANRFAADGSVPAPTKVSVTSVGGGGLGGGQRTVRKLPCIAVRFEAAEVDDPAHLRRSDPCHKEESARRGRESGKLRQAG